MKLNQITKRLFFLTAPLMLIASIGVQAADYILFDLGTLGGSGSSGTSINERREVTGESLTEGDAALHAFIWDAQNGMRDIHMSGAFRSHGADINDSGRVAGTVYYWDGTRHAFLWDDENGMQDLGTLGGQYSWGYGINNHDEITGYSNDINNEYHAFVWRPPQQALEKIGTPGRGSTGYAINDYGEVTGVYYPDPVAGPGRAFLWDEINGTGDLGTLGGGSSLGNDINDIAQVAGTSTTADEAVHAMRWTIEYGMEDLGTLGGTNSFGYGINSSGVVVGTSFSDVSPGTHGFIWDPINGMRDLCEFLDCIAAGWEILYPNDINDNGDIAGGGIGLDGESRAFVALKMQPVFVSIDILPKKAVNTINVRSTKIVQVAILSTAEFVAPEQVNIETVRFGPAAADASRYKFKDVDGNGLADVVFYFIFSETGIECGDSEATLNGETIAGSAFEGTDSILTKGCGRK